MAPSRSQFTVRQKVDVIKCKEENPTWGVRKIAEKFQISKCCVSNILRSKEDILKLFGTPNCENRVRKFRQTEGMKVDHVVFEWYSQLRSRNIPVSGPLIQEKARETALTLGIEKFGASNGWLEKFRKRHGISLKSVSTEEKTTDCVTVDMWIEKIPDILSGYSPINIFNATVTSLYYRAMPNKVMHIELEKFSGGKKVYERLTVFLCCNLTGEKLTPLVIGGTAKLKCFKDIDPNILPVHWRHNDKACMTQDIINEWLLQLNRQMEEEDRKIILFLDSATSRQDLNLKNIKMVFFPPNCTSTCQPMDLGIIPNFKLNYRKLLLKSILANTQQEQTFSDTSKSVDILQAINWIAEAWKKVEFSLMQLKVEEEEENTDLEELQQLLAASGNIVKAEDFISFDSELDTENVVLNIDTMAANIKCENNDFDEENNSDENSQVEPKPFKTHEEVLEQITCARNFFVSVDDDKALYLINQLTLHIEDKISTSIFSKQTETVDIFKTE